MRYYEMKKAVYDGGKEIQKLQDAVEARRKEILEIQNGLDDALVKAKAEILGYVGTDLSKDFVNDLLVIGRLNSVVIENGEVKTTITDMSGRDINFIKNNSKIRVENPALTVKKIDVPDTLVLNAKIARGDVVDMVFSFADEDKGLTVVFDMTIGC